MPVWTSDTPGVARAATVLAIAAITLSSGVYFAIRAPRTGLAPSATVAVWRLEAGSGGQTAICYEDGNCRFSGSIVSDGVLLSTGGSLTFSTTQGIYVNQSGDTMTGKLLVDLTGAGEGIEWIETGTGNILYISKNVAFAASGVVISTSGATVFNEQARSVDFRIEGATATSLFFLDASADRVGINTSLPDTRLDVVGTISGSIVTATQFSPRSLQIALFATGSTAATGSGKAHLWIPQYMSGFNLTAAFFACDVAGTTNVTSVQVRNGAKGSRKLFSTVVSIDSAETDSRTAATPYVIDTTTDDVGAYDKLVFDAPGVSTTAPKSCNVTLDFVAP